MRVRLSKPALIRRAERGALSRAREKAKAASDLEQRIGAVDRLGRGDAGAGLDLDAVVEHRHFRARDGAEQHQLVEVAQMADTEHLAGDFRQTGAEREVVALVGGLDDLGGVKAFRHHDGGDGVRIPLRLLGAGLQAPGRDGGAGAFGEVMVALVNLIETLFEQDVERLLQAVEQRNGRRIGEVAVGVLGDHVLEFEIGAATLVGLAGVDGLLAGDADRDRERDTETDDVVDDDDDGQLHALGEIEALRHTQIEANVVWSLEAISRNTSSAVEGQTVTIVIASRDDAVGPPGFGLDGDSGIEQPAGFHRAQ